MNGEVLILQEEIDNQTEGIRVHVSKASIPLKPVVKANARC